ncbi:hypothetical protein FKM82_030728 [Ascaphus truei]
MHGARQQLSSVSLLTAGVEGGAGRSDVSSTSQMKPSSPWYHSLAITLKCGRIAHVRKTA